MGVLVISKILVKIAGNALALWAATRYISGFGIEPSALASLELLRITPLVQTLVVGGLALALVNLILYPFLKVIAAVLPFITTAMLVVAANLAIVYVASFYLPQLAISGVKPLLLSSILIGLVNSLL